MYITKIGEGILEVPQISKENIIKRGLSYKTMKVLNENLKIGEKVEVIFKKLPTDIYMDGFWWKVDLYREEEKLKKEFKDSLWLTQGIGYLKGFLYIILN